jgi:ABC-type Mn2+/Zn2+ transport system ATPase subunit
MTDPTLALTGIKQSYQPGKWVLEDVNLNLLPGTVTGLLGRNGSGKATLMRIALGVLRPDSGEARLFGHGAWSATRDHGIEWWDAGTISHPGSGAHRPCRHHHFGVQSYDLQ